MSENSTAQPSTIELELETAAVLEVHGQKLYIDQPFAKLGDSFWLTTDDVKRVAVSVCEWLRIRGWFMPQPGIAFVVDRFPHPENLFSFRGVQVGPGEANKFTAVINAHRNALEKQANNARQAVSHLEKKARRKELKLMLHAVMAMTLAHELAHAFGINRSSEFRGLPLEELEILTDSCAFLSCHKMIGNAAVLGMNYLQKRLNGEGLSITSVEKTTELAKAIVAGVKRNEP